MSFKPRRHTNFLSRSVHFRGLEIEPLEQRLTLSVSPSLSGVAPNQSVTFTDDINGSVDNQLEIGISAGGFLQWRVNGGAFSEDLDSTIGLQTALFTSISSISTLMGLGNDSVQFDMVTSDFVVSVGPGAGQQTSVANLDAVTLGHAATLNTSGTELLNFAGADDDDTVSVDPGSGNRSVRVSNFSTDTDQITTDSFLPTIHTSNLETLDVDPTTGGADQVTFAKSNLFGATNYTAHLSNLDTLTIEGTNANDDFTVNLDGSGNIQSGDIKAITSDGLASLQFNGLGGTDSLAVNVAGTALISAPIVFDGGAGNDSLTVSGTPTTAVDESIYTPGPAIGAGTLVYQNAANATLMSIAFANLEPVVDLVPAATLTVAGTNGDDAINYIQGSAATNGLVSVNTLETIEFSNKDNLVLNALAGSDVINLNNPSRPTGSTPGGLKTITVNGADPTGSDTLIVNGIAGTLDNLRFNPTNVGAGNVVNDEAAQPQVNLTGIEHLQLVVQQTDGDGVRVEGTTGNDNFAYSPGATPDSGVFTGQMDTGNATGNGPFAMVETTFKGVNDPSNDVDVNFFNPGGTDTMLFNGTTAADNITVGTGEAGGVGITNIVNGLTISRLEVFNIVSALVRGLAGDDTFNYSAIPTVALAFEGGPQGASGDKLNYTANVNAATTIDMDSDDNVATTGVQITSTGAGNVNLTGIETLNEISSGATSSLQVQGTVAPDSFTYTPTSATGGNVALAGNPTLINFSGVGGNFFIDGGAGGGTDTVTVNGSNGADTINIDPRARTATVNAFKTVRLTGTILDLEVQALLGDDTIIVASTVTESPVLTQLNIYGGNDNDTLIVDSSLSLNFVTGGIHFDGGLGNDAVRLTQTGGVTQTTDAYTVGPNNGQGTSVITGPQGTQTVIFQNVEPLVDLVPTTTLTVNATNSDNAINYAQGSVPANGLVSIDNQETIEFSFKDNLVLNALAGSDAVNLNNVNLPNGVTGALKTITVNAGDPTTNDTLTINGRAGVPNESIRMEPTSQGNGFFTGLGGLTQVNYSGIEHINAVLQFGEGDSFAVDGTAGTDHYKVTSGPNLGVAHIEGSMNGTGPGAFTLPLIDVQGQTVTAAGIYNFLNPGGADTFELVGTDSVDRFDLSAGGNLGSITHFVNNIQTNLFSVANATTVTIDGMNGDDTFNSAGVLPFALNINGGNPSASDTLNLIGASSTVGINLADPSVANSNTTISGYGGLVTLNGVEVVNTDANNNGLTVTGTAQNDALTYTPTGASAGAVQAAGLSTLFNFSGVSGTFTVSGGAGGTGDTLNVNGSNSPDTITVDSTLRTAQVNTLKTVTLDASLEYLNVSGQSGGDNFVVRSSGGLTPLQRINIFGNDGNDTLQVDSSTGLVNSPEGIHYDGGTGFDAIQLTQAGGVTQTTDTYTVGPNNGQGTSVITGPSGTQSLFFQNVEPFLDLVPAASLVVNATTSDNAINYTSGTVNPVSDGMVTIDNQESIEFSLKDALVINALAGNDSINLNNPNIPAGATPGGLKSITVNAGDPTASDTLIVNGRPGFFSEVMRLNPTGAGAGNIVDVVQPTINYTGVEHINAVMQFNENDTFTVDGTVGNDNYRVTSGPDAGRVHIEGTMGIGGVGPFSLPAIDVFGQGSAAGGNFNFLNVGGSDTFELIGSGISDRFDLAGLGGANASATHFVNGNQVNFFAFSNMTSATVDGLEGDDTFNVAGSFPFALTLDGGGPSASDIANFTGATGLVTVNLGDSSSATPNTVITGYGSPVTLVGIEVANMDATGNGLTVVGTAQNDLITYTPTGPSAGTFSNFGLNTIFNFTTVTGTFTINGGSGGNADQVVIQGTNARDLFQIDQGARTAQLLANNVNAWKTVTLGTNIEELAANGLAGQDTFQIIPAAGIGPFPLDNLLITVDGGSATGENNALVIAASFGGAQLPATTFVVVNKSADPNAGTVRVFQNAAANPDIDYKNVQVVSPNVAGGSLNPNLLIMGPDTNEPNENQGNATFMGSGSTLQIQHGAIFPDSNEFPGVPSDVDFYRVVAQNTGTLDFQVYFRLFALALLPAGGAINLEVRDAAGNIVASAPGILGTVGATANARIRISAVAGQSYFLRVFGAVANAVNGYDATIINTPAPVPANLELSRSVPPPVAGNPDTGDLPATAPGDDSGRSQFDNVTRTNNPTIFVRLDDALLLNDLPGNQTPGGVPPMGAIPIPFNSSTALGATGAGYRIALFDGGNGAPVAGVAHTLDPNDPTFIGWAQPVPGFPHLYSLKIGSQGVDSLADGLHFITARVQMIDPAVNTQRGFGDRSAALQIIVDTAPPPVFFGVPTIATDGLDAGSDSGVVGDQASFVDRITNVTAPTFFGTAEANSIIRLYADIDGNPAHFVLLGQTTAVPIDGTNAFPNGRWVLKSNVNLNDPAFFPHDGLRHIVVTAEDLAGNVSDTQLLNIFIDTQGPQVTNVEITNIPDFNLFGLKPNNAAQGPTPLINSLTIRLQDLPGNDALFLRNAIEAGVAATPGVILLKGDHNGYIAINNIIVTNDPPQPNVASTATIVLQFNQPLPDDRFTLTILDTLPDIAGNRLDGESNAIEPLDVPQFPSGDGQPGGNFVARFTVDSRPEIGTYAAARVFVDINGNMVADFQGQDNDAVNRDLTFGLGIVPSLNGVVSPMGIHDTVFAGNFPGNFEVPPDDGEDDEVDAQPAQLAPGSTADGFDKLAAYGNDPTSGGFRWLIDTNNDGVIDPSKGDHATKQPAGFQINGLPIAGNFDGNSLNGDEIGLFDGTKWYFDTNHNFVIDGGDTVVSTALRGLPIVGDFNGDGVVDLATWKDDVFYFSFGSGGGGGQPTWSGAINATINWGLPGVSELPVAGDMDKDGITDIGLFVPARAGTLPISSGNWQFLLSNDFEHNNVGGNQVTDLNHPFSPVPLGSDLFAQFGDAFALPVVGNFDPPIAKPVMPNPTALSPMLATTTIGAKAINGDQWYSFTPLRSGTVSITPTVTSGSVNIELDKTNFQSLGSITAAAGSTTPLTAQVTAGQTYLIKVSGQGNASFKLTNSVPMMQRLDTSLDGYVKPIDVLKVVNDLLLNGTHNTAMSATNTKMYLDTNMDGKVSPLDALQVINYLLGSTSGSSGTSGGGSSAAPMALVASDDDGSQPDAAPMSVAAASSDDSNLAFALTLSAGTVLPSATSAASVAPATSDAVFADLASDTASQTNTSDDTAELHLASDSEDSEAAEELDLSWVG